MAADRPRARRVYEAIVATIQTSPIDYSTEPCAGDAPMTRNNLAVHLKWLLTQSASSNSLLSGDAPPIERARASQQPTPPSDESELLEAILEEHDNADDEVMAKTNEHSLSTRKHRLISRPDTWQDESPSTSNESRTKSKTKGGQNVLFVTCFPYGVS